MPEEIEKLDSEESVINENSETTENLVKTENQTNIDDVKKDDSSKKNLIKKILIGIVILLLLLIITFSSLFFLGFFETEKKELQANSSETPNSVNSEIIIKKEIKSFDISRLNTVKLNKELEKLTSKQLEITTKSTENEKKDDENKILEDQKEKQIEELRKQEEALNEEKKLIEERKTQLEEQKNELLALKDEAIKLRDIILLEKQNIETQLNENKEDFSKKTLNEYNLITVAIIDGKLYKDYLDRVLRIDTEIKLCRDDKNRIVIYSGPYENEKAKNEMLNVFQNKNFKNSFFTTLSQEDFNKQCNY